MLAQSSPVSYSQPTAPNQHFGNDLERSQEFIYEYLVQVVKYCSPEAALAELQSLFIHAVSATSSTVNQAVYQLLVTNHELEFRYTLKRSCYILINNWTTQKNHQAIQELIELFNKINFNRKTASLTIKRLHYWLENFVKSPDYEELKLFGSVYTASNEKPWSSRYTSYLLVSQYINKTNSAEQRESARNLSHELKETFKRDLAFYVARSQCTTTHKSDSKNPTLLGNDVLLLIKRLVTKKGIFSYMNLANIFIKQTQELTYKYFKRSLKRYLVYSMSDQDLAVSLREQLKNTLEPLYDIHHDRLVDSALLLRTCNRLIEALTTENRQEPSRLFTVLMAQKTPITLVVLLLKIILICPNARTHLEGCVADLIRYYENMPATECEWVINFLEIFNIIFAIHAEDVEYNLVKVDPLAPDTTAMLKPTAYQIFAQLRSYLSLADLSISDRSIISTTPNFAA